MFNCINHLHFPVSNCVGRGSSTLLWPEADNAFKDDLEVTTILTLCDFYFYSKPLDNRWITSRLSPSKQCNFVLLHDAIGPIGLPVCYHHLNIVSFLFLQDAIGLLEPMTNDPVNYVRQGALIASALVTIQQNEVTCPKVSLDV